MKRIFATTAAVLALAGLGAGAGLAGVNVGSQSAGIDQITMAKANAFNFGGGAVVNLNSSTAKSGNWAAITQQLGQLNH